MAKFYTKDYNEYVKEHRSARWSHYARNGSYIFNTPNGDKTLKEFVQEYNIKSLIDYGCGDGHGTDKLDTETQVIKYDPFVPKFSSHPTTKVDMVVGHNLLNCIEPEHLSDVIQDICQLTNKFVLLNIVTYPGLYGLRAPTYIEHLIKYFDFLEYHSYNSTGDLGAQKHHFLYLLLRKKND